jgi:hypothetical protein
MSEETQPVLDDETAKRLSAAMRKLDEQLSDFGALPPGSRERAKKWDERTKIEDESNSFFRPI